MIDIIIAAAIGLLIYGYWGIFSYNGPASEENGSTTAAPEPLA